MKFRGRRHVEAQASQLEAGFNTSVGNRGDSNDNALTETINGLYKTEVIHKDGPWQEPDEVELTALS